MTIQDIQNEITSEKRKNSFPTTYEYETQKIKGYSYLKNQYGEVLRVDEEHHVIDLGRASTKKEFCKIIQSDIAEREEYKLTVITNAGSESVHYGDTKKQAKAAYLRDHLNFRFVRSITWSIEDK